MIIAPQVSVIPKLANVNEFKKDSIIEIIYTGINI